MAFIAYETDIQKVSPVTSLERFSLLVKLPQIQTWITAMELDPMIQLRRDGQDIPQAMWDKLKERQAEWLVKYEAFAQLTTLPKQKDDLVGFWHTVKLALRRLLLDRENGFPLVTIEHLRLMAKLLLVQEWLKKVKLFVIWVAREADGAYVATKAQEDAADAAVQEFKGGRDDEKWNAKLSEAINTPL